MSMVETDIVLQAIEGLWGGIDTLTSKLDAAQDDLDALKAKGILKSSQYGRFQGSAYNNPDEASIVISPVDPSKSVFIYSFIDENYNEVSVKLLEDGTGISVYHNLSGTSKYGAITWTIAEFY